MKKFLLIGALVVALGAYAWWNTTSSIKYPSNQTLAVSPPSSTTSSQPIATLSQTQPSAVGTNGTYKNGSYTGPVVNAFYGLVQVKTAVQQGQLTDVVFLQYPNGDGHAIEVNSYAMPLLKSEAIAAQSAQVNVISGATQTSLAFQQSLGSALAQAQ